MSNLIVITFEDAETAGQVREDLRSIQKEGQLSLDDSAVVVKDAEGKLHVRNEMDRGVKVGAVGGGALGLLISSIFFPFAGLIMGAVAGAVVGKMVDLGVDQKFVHQVAAQLQPNTSALFVLIREANAAAALAALRPYKGQVYHTSLPPEAEEELRYILKRQG
jgi:uncharacterized membrane protein